MKLFIDGSNITYICMFTAERYDEPLKEFTKIYANVMNKIQRSYPFHEMIIAWEGQGNSIKHRLELFPEYKQQRVKKASTEKYRKLAQEYNAAQIWPNVSLQDTEADDVIYAMAHIFKETAATNIVISADHDYIQLVQEGLISKIYSQQTKKYLKIPEYDIVMFKALTGDSADNIPGVKGCGPKTAIKYMENGIPPEHLKTAEKFFGVVSMSMYSEIHNTIELVKEILSARGVSYE